MKKKLYLTGLLAVLMMSASNCREGHSDPPTTWEVVQDYPSSEVNGPQSFDSLMKAGLK